MRDLWFDEERLNEYFTNRFVSDLEDYFSIPNDTNEIKYVGKPKFGSKIFHLSSVEQQIMFIALTSYMLSAKENLLFASIMLYQVIAEQSILDVAPKAINDFHKAFGWPMISSGPGGGPYLHPLKMLEYAGLSPMKYEAPLLLVYVRKMFYYLRQEMNTILNCRESVIKDKEAACRFFEQCDGHAKIQNP